MHAHTDIGKRRDTNEDDVLTASFDGTDLLVVADGMGGHAAGDVASDIATTELKNEVEHALAGDRKEYETILGKAITKANEEIRTRAADDPSLSGMGTTVVAAVVDNGEATIANVGDSRGYHIDEEIEQITVDQSLVQELIEQGEITETEAEDHPQRNVVSQALGTTDSVEPDFYHQTVSGTLLLCSDGLSEEVPDSRMAEIIAEESTLADAAETLIEQANDNGGSDNITVALYS